MKSLLYIILSISLVVNIYQYIYYKRTLHSYEQTAMKCYNEFISCKIEYHSLYKACGMEEISLLITNFNKEMRK